jgi:hypothetical protein
MRARAPLDVDLEDKLLYGLTPTRLGYLVLALLAVFAFWSSPWAPSLVRGALCLLVAAIGATAAWGRWRGRPVEAWFGDISLFVINNHRLTLNRSCTRWFDRWRQNPPTPPLAAGPRSIVVVDRKPKAGASTVAAELVACLAAGRHEGETWLVKQAPSEHDQSPGEWCVVLSVAAVEGYRICYLDRGAGPSVAGLIPEDDCVRQAAALGEATVVAFPDSAAGRAFRALAEVIAGEA